MMAGVLARVSPAHAADAARQSVEDAPETARSSRGAVAALRRSGEIGDAHVHAADRWYRDWVMGVEGATDPDIVRSGRAPDIHAGMLSRVAACARCSEVRRSLGAQAEQRLRMLLIDELSFSEIGRQLLPADTNSRKKIAAQSVMLLEMLAEHYHDRDQAARARPASNLRNRNVSV